MTVCHRDFYDKQILFDGTRSTLIDYDTLSEGDASHDYGNFMAHLHWRAMQEPGAAELIDAGIDAFDRHRLVINPAAQGRVGWWTAATRLRIACLYLWRPRWTELAGAFLTDSLSRLTVTA
jgi:Ser/Thr protein kinase RdoA (MazF antagonist)